MKVATKLKTLIAGTALAIVANAPVHAATLNQQFANDFSSNAIYFWVAAGSLANLDFASFSFTTSGTYDDMADWTVFANTGDSAILTGSIVAPGQGRFNTVFSYSSAPFALQWAEVLWNGPTMTLQGAGSLSWNGGWSASGTFTHAGDIFAPVTAPVPVPRSLVLLLSALLPLGLRNWRISRRPAA